MSDVIIPGWLAPPLCLLIMVSGLVVMLDSFEATLESAEPDPFALPVSNAVAAPSAPSFGPDTRPWFPVPEHMRGDNSVIVHFVSSDQISAYCSPDANACYHRSIRAIFMPNPCEHVPDFSAFSYTHTLCHELAHANGWMHEIEAATPTQGEDQ